jgi:hypothetical protein
MPEPEHVPRSGGPGGKAEFDATLASVVGAHWRVSGGDLARTLKSIESALVRKMIDE